MSFRSEVTLEILAGHLNDISLFSAAPARLQSQLAMLLRWDLYPPGEYLGGLSFFLKERRTSHVIAKEFTEALILDRALFDQLIEQEPVLRDIIKEMASRRSERNQNLLLTGVIV